jgi:hypothetical protein
MQSKEMLLAKEAEVKDEGKGRECRKWGLEGKRVEVRGVCGCKSEPEKANEEVEVIFGCADKLRSCSY